MAVLRADFTRGELVIGFNQIKKIGLISGPELKDFFVYLDQLIKTNRAEADQVIPQTTVLAALTLLEQKYSHLKPQNIFETINQKLDDAEQNCLEAVHNASDFPLLTFMGQVKYKQYEAMEQEALQTIYEEDSRARSTNESPDYHSALTQLLKTKEPKIPVIIAPNFIASKSNWYGGDIFIPESDLIAHYLRLI